MECPSCKTDQPENAEFCGKCGFELKDSSASNQQPADDSVAVDPAAAEELAFLTAAAAPITIASSGRTHTGLIKENNEDVYLVRRVEYPHHKMEVHVLLIADGMGGEPAGEVFAEMALHETWSGIRFLLPHFEHHLTVGKWEFWKYMNTQLAAHIRTYVELGNRRVRMYAKAKNLELGKCGATIVAAVAVSDLETGHVVLHGYNEGDARCAVIVDDKLTQLSTDHTTDGAPYRFLGKHDHVSGSSFTKEFWMTEADSPAFWVLTYSDGLWNMLSPEQITALTKETDNTESFCQVAIATALSVREPHGFTLGDDQVKPGDDNITIAALRCARSN